MAIDPQGVFYGSEEDLGALEAKYKKPDLASQIPGQVSTSQPDRPRSLRERAVSALTQANPLMIAKSFQDMTKTLVGGAALPVVAPISAGVQALNALPGNLYRRSRGEQEVKTPSADELMRRYGQTISPQTQAGQSFQEGLGKLMDTLKVPHAWPVTPNVPRRPLLTPTDVRVGAGQIRQVAKELRETPADFQAAQSGLKRQNLYGEDTLGVRAQAAADALGDTLDRRRSAGLSAIPGVPQAVTPETSMFAVRPGRTRLVQPKIPDTARGYAPEYNTLNDIVSDVYGDTPAAQMPPEMVMSEYADRYLPAGSDIRDAVTNYGRNKAQEMFPDAPNRTEAQRAYDVLYSNRTERNRQQLSEVEEFLSLPENAVYRENTPTPSEFMQRMAEAERVLKGPFTTFISKNVGAEGDPTVKLARQGITFEDPAVLADAAQFADAASLAKKRLAAGFPAEGSFYEERLSKTEELDRLSAEIQNLEDIRRPLFEQAQAQGVDPASISGYAETTNPLRQKLRQREQLQGELENIDLATKVENLSDFAVGPKTREELLKSIPFTERQFFPSVTKAGESETLYTGNRSLIRELGFDKLGKQLFEDILTGKAGDTSKLTIENYMREKGLSRIEAEKAAKLQQQQYRTALQNALLERIRSDQNVQTFGNAAIITLDENTPRDVAMRDMSADTTVLDHCVGQCGTAPQGRKNILSGKQQYYEPVIDPITGERSSRASGDTSYVTDLQAGHQLVSVRDAKTGLPAATIQLIPNSRSRDLSDGKFDIGYASGAKNGAVNPAYSGAIRDYLNSRADSIRSTGGNLSDNTGVFDSTSPAEFRRAAREAGLTNEQVKAMDWGDLPRFITVDDVKAVANKAAKAVAVQEAPVVTLNERDYEVMRGDLNAALQNVTQAAVENSAYSRPEAVQEGINRIVARVSNLHLNDPVAFTREGATQLRRAERDLENSIENAYAQRTDLDDEIALALEDFMIDVRGIRDNIERRLAANEAGAREQAPAVQPDPSANAFDDIGDWEPDPTAVANQPAPAQVEDRFALALRYNIPPVTVQEIQARFRDDTLTLQNLNSMARNAVEGARGSIFENLPEESRLGAEQMIRDEIGRRAAVEPQAPAQPAAQLAQRNPVPRDIQVMARADLMNAMEPRGITQAQELARTYFNDNVIDGNNVSISSLTGMLRDYRIGPHAAANPDVREFAARELEAMHNESMMGAEILVDHLNGTYMDMDPEEARSRIDRDISWLERSGEAGWADLLGPTRAAAIPWNRNIQHHLIEYLLALRENREGFAKGGMVKKKRKAKKARTPSVVTRRSPELAEMQYRYGGMVC